MDENAKLKELKAVCIEDVLFASVSEEDVEASNDSNWKPAYPVRYDIFKSDRNRFCGQLDIYLRKLHGNWCLTDWRVNGGISEACLIDMPFEITCRENIPESPSKLIRDMIRHAKRVHDDNDEVGKWKQVSINLPQRITAERLEAIRKTHATVR